MLHQLVEFCPVLDKYAASGTEGFVNTRATSIGDNRPGRACP
jgi:hypothetical protein